MYTLLKNYPKAIAALEDAMRIGPNPRVYALLGKVQMKARMWPEAVANLRQALNDMVRSSTQTRHGVDV